MLKIHVDTLEGEITSPSKYFDSFYEREWFDDPFVKQMVLDVDQTVVYSALSMESEYLGIISCKELSGSVKNLILAYKTDNIIDASFCGDNCAKWFIEIGKRKDLIITLQHIMLLSGNFEIFFINSNKFVYNGAEYAAEMAYLLFEAYKKRVSK